MGGKQTRRIEESKKNWSVALYLLAIVEGSVGTQKPFAGVILAAKRLARRVTMRAF
jgi:hypothetical protein